jgi:hypothetical protein
MRHRGKLSARVVAGCVAIVAGIALVALAPAPPVGSDGNTNPSVQEALSQSPLVNDQGPVGLQAQEARVVGNVLVVAGFVTLVLPRLRQLWRGQL